MKPYPKYKPSGIDWLGEIPFHWELKRLKYSDEIIMGQSPSSNDYNDNHKGFPFLQGNADFGLLNPSPTIWCERANKIIDVGDILLSVRAPIGAVNIADRKYGIGRGLCAMRAKKSHPKFLYYILVSLADELNSIGTGSTYTAISVEEVENIFCVSPPFEEQLSIANFLDKKTEQIDTLVSKKQKLIELLKEERTAIINEAVSGEGKNWERKKLKYVGKAIIGITYSPNDVSPNKKGILVLRSSNIQNGKLAFLDNVFINKEVSQKYFTKEGDILICARNGSAHLVGKCALIDTQNENLTWGAFMSIFRTEYGEYLYHYFNSDLFRRNIGLFSTSTVFQLTSDILNNLLVAFPKDKNELKQTIEHIQTETQRINKIVSTIEKEIELLQEYRTALISEAVTGKIDLTAVRQVVREKDETLLMAAEPVEEYKKGK